MTALSLALSLSDIVQSVLNDACRIEKIERTASAVPRLSGRTGLVASNTASS